VVSARWSVANVDQGEQPGDWGISASAWRLPSPLYPNELAGDNICAHLVSSRNKSYFQQSEMISLPMV
jgi:hypothetical protein